MVGYAKIYKRNVIVREHKMLRVQVQNSTVRRNILSLEGFLRFVTVVAVFGMLAACSSAADTTRTVVKSLNPVNWFDDDEEDKQKKPLAAAKPGATSKSFPTIGSVPARPKRPSPEAETKQIAEGLAADTANARYSDQQLRKSSAVFGGNAQPPSTIRPSSPIKRPSTIRNVSPPAARGASSSTTAARPPATVRGGIVPPPAIRPSSPASRVAPPKPRAPVVAPPPVKAPAAKAVQRRVAPPPLKAPAVTTRSAPLPVAPPPVKAPTLARVSPPPPVVPPPVNAPTLAKVAPPPPKTAVPSSPTAAQGTVQPPTLANIAPSPVQATGVRRERTAAPVAAPQPATQVRAPTVATPVAQPREAPKPPPVATPIGGPLNQRAVSLQPPAAARVSSTSVSTSTPPAQEATPKTVQVGTIYFGDGSSRLSSEDTSILRAVSDVFRQTGGKVRVVGHSSMGAASFNASQRESVNYRMSLKRANAVANELIRNGIPAESVEVIAEGDRVPAYAETSQTGAAYNRRAEIFIDYLERS